MKHPLEEWKFRRELQAHERGMVISLGITNFWTTIHAGKIKICEKSSER
jgi:hypothetical protein